MEDNWYDKYTLEELEGISWANSGIQYLKEDEKNGFIGVRGWGWTGEPPTTKEGWLNRIKDRDVLQFLNEPLENVPVYINDKYLCKLAEWRLQIGK